MQSSRNSNYTQIPRALCTQYRTVLDKIVNTFIFSQRVICHKMQWRSTCTSTYENKSIQEAQVSRKHSNCSVLTFAICYRQVRILGINATQNLSQLAAQTIALSAVWHNTINKGATQNSRAIWAYKNNYCLVWTAGLFIVYRGQYTGKRWLHLLKSDCRSA